MHSHCQNREKIEQILQHFGLRKIQNTTYTEDLTKIELKDNINENIKEKDQVGTNFRSVLAARARRLVNSERNVRQRIGVRIQLLKIVRPDHVQPEAGRTDDGELSI